MSAERDQARKRLQENTAIDRLLPALRGQLRNLGSLAGKLDATSCDRPMRGETVICVGAGPSLDAAREWLREARRKGVPVIAAAPAARAMEWQVDVAVSVEGIGGSRAIPADDWPGILAVNACAAADAWERADAWFSDYFPYSAELAKTLRHRPLWYPGNVGPAVVGLALEWGAAEVVLVGFDLAYTGGRAYASGTPWADTTLRREGASVVFSHMQERQETYAAAGSSSLPERHQAVEVRAWGNVIGETVYTTHDYIAQIEGLETIAKSFKSSAKLVNATEGGAHIEGWADVHRREMAFDGMPLDWPEALRKACRATTAEHVADTYEHLRYQEERLRNAAVDELEHGGKFSAWRNWIIGGGFTMGAALCVPDFVAMNQGPIETSPHELKRRFVIMHAAADELRSWIPGGE